MTADFGWDYPPGVTGNEYELTGEWPCEDCGRAINDITCCELHNAHCKACCPDDGEDNDDHHANTAKEHEHGTTD